MTLLTSSTGIAPRMAVEGEYVYWQELECNTGGPAPKSVIRRRRADGGPIVDIAQGPSAETELRVGPQHIYWIGEFGTVLRAPK